MRSTNRRRPARLPLAALALTAIAAAGQPPATAAATVPAAPPPGVHIRLDAGALALTGTPRPGPLPLTLAGGERATIAVIELRPGHTPAELTGLAGLADAAPIEKIGRLVAGATVRPGATYRTTILARRRTYVAVDVTHDNGPSAAFTATGAPTHTAPAADVRIAIRDDGFSVPAHLPAHGVIRIDNTGRLPHQALAIRIRNGLSIATAKRLATDGGSPQRAGTPRDLVGLVSAATTNLVEIPLQPGRYLLVSYHGTLLPHGQPDSRRGLLATTRVR